MATVGTINVGIRADTRKFDKGMRDSRKRMSQFDKSAKNLRRTMIGLGSALLGAVAIRSFSQAIGGAITRLDDLAKTSAKLGIASEQLAGLQHAANQTGVATQSLNQGLEKMVLHVSEAAQGTGTAVDALKELGLSAIDLNQLSPDKQFVRIAEAMKGVENQADRVRLTYDIFGRSGVALANTLKVGADGLAEFNKEAEALGLAIKNEDLKKVERLNDAMDRFGKAKSGAMNEITIGIAPKAADILEAFTEAWTGRASNVRKDDFATKVGNVTGKLPTGAILTRMNDRQRFDNFGRAKGHFGAKDQTGREDIIASLMKNGMSNTQARLEAQRLTLAQEGGGHPTISKIEKQIAGVTAREDASSQGANFLLGKGSSAASGAGNTIAGGLKKGASLFEQGARDWQTFTTKINKRAEAMIPDLEFAASLREQFQDPAAVLGDQLERITTAFESRLIGADVARRAGQSAVDAFGMSQPGTTSGNQNRLASLAEVGTIEGFRAMRQRGSDDPQKKQVDLAGKQLEQLKKLNEQIGNMGGGVVVLGENAG